MSYAIPIIGLLLVALLGMSSRMTPLIGASTALNILVGSVTVATIPFVLPAIDPEYAKAVPPFLRVAGPIVGALGFLTYTVAGGTAAILDRLIIGPTNTDDTTPT